MKLVSELETRDDRREIYRLLSHVRPSWRWAWLAWVASLAPLPGRLYFSPLDYRMMKEAHAGCRKAEKYVTGNAYGLGFMVASNYGLDWAIIERGLVLLARGKIRPADLRHIGERNVRGRNDLAGGGDGRTFRAVPAGSSVVSVA